MPIDELVGYFTEAILEQKDKIARGENADYLTVLRLIVSDLGLKENVETALLMRGELIY